MGEIAKQAAQVEAVKQAGKISPLAGQITQAAAATVQQSAGKSAGILNGNNTGMNMDDFIMH